MAGMAMWFPSEPCKVAAWIRFPNEALSSGGCLTLGTCNVSAECTRPTGKKAGRVVFVAGRDTRFWATNIMFGASLTPFPDAHCWHRGAAAVLATGTVQLVAGL